VTRWPRRGWFPELGLPAPGLTADQCRVALAHLAARARAAADRAGGEALDSLREEVDLELRLRATVEGQARMSAPEAVVYEPTVRRLRIVLQATQRAGTPPQSVAGTLTTIAEAGLARLTELRSA
jgi:hypothetical protein